VLDRRLMIEQPRHGYRIAMDTVLLAAAVTAQAGDKVIDFGCGVGGASLCLGWRVADVQITGIELQPELAELARRNVARNPMRSVIRIHQGDVTDLPPELRHSFDHVMMNPPYHDAPRHDVSENTGRRLANAEQEGELAHWIASAAVALKDQGIVTMIHRADRKAEIISLLQTDFGAIDILLLAPKAGAVPKRVIIRAMKAAPLGLVRQRDIILHQADGRYTAEIEQILRHGQSLDFVMT